MRAETDADVIRYRAPGAVGSLTVSFIKDPGFRPFIPTFRDPMHCSSPVSFIDSSVMAAAGFPLPPLRMLGSGGARRPFYGDGAGVAGGGAGGVEAETVEGSRGVRKKGKAEEIIKGG